MHQQAIAEKLKLKLWQIENVLKLKQQDATVPFIARYRKEKTGDLDEVQIRAIFDEMERLEEFDKRRNYILAQIESLGKLTPELKQSILACQDADVLEDLYLPYKSKRKTKADVAREAGFEPLAAAIFAQKGDQWTLQWKSLVKDASVGLETALEYARDIVAEWINEDAILRSKLRKLFEENAVLQCKVARGKSTNADAQKYNDYFDHKERLFSCPSHRFLAMNRGEAEGWLKLHAAPAEEDVVYVLKRHCLKGYGDSQDQIKLAMVDAWSRLIQPSLETEMLGKVKEKSDEEAIKVFAENVRQLLLAPPLGEKRILAIDPGFRTGCKVVAIGETGELLGYENIFPHQPQNETEKSAKVLAQMIADFSIDSIAVGNGTAGRETEDFIKGLGTIQLPVFMVNEAGASIYSASEVAREEFPDKDVTVRGAISIGRRLMDPLAELVKIDPKSIGVGQYQHDVNQGLLKKRLDAVVETSVNKVGVNLNTASRYLLSHISGLGPVLAKNIVDYRQSIGQFQSRDQLKKVPRLGEKVFEQCAGFLRIRNAKNPLDNSAVHPERYEVVQRMAADCKVTVSTLLADPERVKKINPQQYVSELESLGISTIQDILKELQKPGLDPRGGVESIEFSAHIRSIGDLDSGMELNGIVTNIVDFGAFVDIGVKQDGLVHISQITQKFIKHPMEVLALGQHVKVRITEVDVQRKRIGLTMKF